MGIFIYNATIIMVVLKLFGLLDWYWWQVLSPIWGLFLLVVLAVIVGDLVAGTEESPG
jgi:hypothetical protein